MLVSPPPPGPPPAPPGHPCSGGWEPWPHGRTPPPEVPGQFCIWGEGTCRDRIRILVPRFKQGPKFFPPNVPPKFPPPIFFCKILFFLNFPAFLPHHTPPQHKLPPKIPPSNFFLKFFQKLPPSNFFCIPPKSFPTPFFYFSPKIPPQISTISF